MKMPRIRPLAATLMIGVVVGAVALGAVMGGVPGIGNALFLVSIAMIGVIVYWLWDEELGKRNRSADMRADTEHNCS